MLCYVMLCVILGECLLLVDRPGWCSPEKESYWL